MVAQTKSKTRSPTVVEYALDALRTGIKEGRYTPGQRLIEVDLTRELNVSRGPVREAMHRLAGEGLVVIEPHRGVVVRLLTRKDVAGLYEVREVIEGLAARLAAKHIDQADNAKRLRAAIKQMRDVFDSGDAAKYMESNERLHGLIFELSGNDTLIKMVQQLRLPVFRLQFSRMMRSSGEAKNDSVEDHEKVVQAILAGNPQKAERAMRKHVRHAGRMILYLPDNSFGP
jgi:DNA-binding GntR family transcriptional regulator